MSAHGDYRTAQATTTAVNGATASVIFTVPQGKAWTFSRVAVSVDAGINKVEIFAGARKIWEDLVNVTTEQVLDLLTRYPRALQVGASETIELKVTTNEAVAKTLTGKAWTVEYGG